MTTTWIGPEKILAKKKEYLLPCLYHFYQNPPQIVRGKGVFVYDNEGRKYLDLFAGVSVHALGHCHPELVKTICDQVSTLQHTTTIYLNQSIVNLAEALAQYLPGDLNKSFFCASGTEAVEGACLLATLHTKSSEFIALSGGLHGRTKLGMSLTGLSFWRTDPKPVGGVSHIPTPHYNPISGESNLENSEKNCLASFKKTLESKAGKIAAFLAEPVQGNGGIRFFSPAFFQEIHRLIKAQGGLFIVDETQTGFGRTGKKFGFEHYGITPDIVCGGKALGGGTPIGFFSTTPEIASSYTRPGASTFGGNPVTAEAAQKFLEIIQRDNIAEMAAEKGRFLGNLLNELSSHFPEHIAQVRGLGLMWGVELKDHAKRSASDLTDLILEDLKDQGILLGKTGPERNVLSFLPPLVIPKEELERSVLVLKETMSRALSR